MRAPDPVPRHDLTVRCRRPWAYAPFARFSESRPLFTEPTVLPSPCSNPTVVPCQCCRLSFAIFDVASQPRLASTLRDTQAPPPIRNTDPTLRTNIVESLCQRTTCAPPISTSLSFVEPSKPPPVVLCCQASRVLTAARASDRFDRRSTTGTTVSRTFLHLVHVKHDGIGPQRKRILLRLRRLPHQGLSPISSCIDSLVSLAVCLLVSLNLTNAQVHSLSTPDYCQLHSFEQTIL